MSGTPTVNPTDLQQALRLFHEPGSVFEIRIPDARLVSYNGKPDPRTATAYGYFDNVELAVRVLEKTLSGAEFTGCYVTMNPVPLDLLARAENRMKAAGRKDGQTSDKDIRRRRWLLIDCDPKRASGISSTDAEKAAARARALEIRLHLRSLGWPDPVLADSGNGYHLLYRIDLPASDPTVQAILETLKAKFSDPEDAPIRVGVDTTVGNAARITKAYGTIVRKGDSTADRPHRMSRIEDEPDELHVVPDELLRALAPAAPSAPPPASPKPKGSFDLDRFMATYFPDATSKPWQGGSRWPLPACPFDESHKGGSAAILRFASGAISFKCQHDGCTGREWKDVREKYEPKATRPAPAPQPGREPPAPIVTYEGIPVPPPRPRPTLPGAALYGLAGRWVRAVAPHTEGDPLGILGAFLARFGIAVGRGPHFRIGGTRHGTNLFICLVGPTSTGRKQTADAEAARGFRIAGRIPPTASGLSSGEGLISAVRDEVKVMKPVKEKGKTIRHEEVVEDPGVSDKRLVVVESEFGSVLRRMERDGNTLSPVIRQAWDGDTLRTLIKKSLTATEPHIGIVASITPSELQALLAEGEVLNGFGNRFLWLDVLRPRLVPGGGKLRDSELIPLADELRDAIEQGGGMGEIQMDRIAQDAWDETLYPILTQDRIGAFGSMTTRAAPQIQRLSMIYAILDGSHVIGMDHLRAGLAFWQAAEESARGLFGDQLGDRVAETILGELREAGAEGRTRGQLCDTLGRNVPSARIGQALALLSRWDLARGRRETTPGRGRPTERWLIFSLPHEINEINELNPGPQDGLISLISFNSSEGEKSEAAEAGR